MVYICDAGFHHLTSTGIVNCFGTASSDLYVERLLYVALDVKSWYDGVEKHCNRAVTFIDESRRNNSRQQLTTERKCDYILNKTKFLPLLSIAF